MAIVTFAISVVCMIGLINNIEQGLDHFGRTTEPKHLTEDNAWVKDYDYNWRDDNNPRSNWRSVNKSYTRTKTNDRGTIQRSIITH